VGIRFHCPNGHKLHVKAFLAGKRGVCPHCGAKFTIPPTELGAVTPRPRREPADSSAKLPSPAPPLGGSEVSRSASTAAIWHVRLPSGDEYGPTTDSMLRSWIAEGRVSPDSLVWREGWDEWRAMNGLFSSPSSTPVPPVPEVPDPSPPSSTPVDVPTIVTPIAVATDTPTMVKHRRKRQVRRLVVILAILCLVLLVPLVYMLAA
jgi:hypothetical protein